MLPLHRIIPFSNVEGLGNRTSIFLSGCNINCLYCHNPETIIRKDNNLISIDELLKIIKSSMPFIRGITVSGGEPTIYHKELSALFKEVHKLGISCYIDTNGFFDKDEIDDLIQNTDKFLFDIKGLGEGLDKLCFSDNYLPKVDDLSLINNKTAKNRNIENLRYLLPLNKVEEVRLIHIKGYYDEKFVLDTLWNEMSSYDEVYLKIIRVHLRGTRAKRELIEGMPKSDDTKELFNYAKKLGFQKLSLIL